MPLIKVKNSTEKYQEIAKNLSHSNELTGRGFDTLKTQYRATSIYDNLSKEKLKLNSMIDVGCGDATFLLKLNELATRSIGILPTEEEILAVKKIISDNNINNVEIKRGLSDSLPEVDNSIDFLLCNSVIHGVGFDSTLVDNSLREFSRILKNGSYIYIGELPEKNEMEGRDYGTSVFRYLMWGARVKGIKYFSQQLFSMVTAKFSSRNYIIQPTSMFFESKCEFIFRLRSHGFDIINVYDSDTNELVTDNFVLNRRLDYFCKLYK